MANVYDVAKYVLKKLGSMSTMKLQKEVYYCQAWSLGWDGKSLFDEDFQAWANGPVCPELFSRHKGLFWITTETRSPSGSAIFPEADCQGTAI